VSAQSGGRPEQAYTPAPELFSSSYIVRRTQSLENEERERAGLPAIYYKMAAANPRKPGEPR
jgi:hypothetical protein